MKKKLILLLFIVLTSLVYCEDNLNVLKFKKLVVSDMVSFTENEKPFYIDIEKVSNQTFVARNKAALSDSFFLNGESKTIENIKNHLAKKENIFSVYNEFIIFDWISMCNADISIQYTQSKNGIIYGCGVYVIRVFLENCVYIIRLYDQKYCRRYDEYFNSKKEFFYFQEGSESNAMNGVEGEEGYYCKNNDSAELFYKYMINCNERNDYAYKFYKLYETVIAAVINNINE